MLPSGQEERARPTPSRPQAAARPGKCEVPCSLEASPPQPHFVPGPCKQCKQVAASCHLSNPTLQERCLCCVDATSARNTSFRWQKIKRKPAGWWHCSGKSTLSVRARPDRSHRSQPPDVQPSHTIQFLGPNSPASVDPFVSPCHHPPVQLGLDRSAYAAQPGTLAGLANGSPQASTGATIIAWLAQHSIPPSIQV